MSLTEPIGVGLVGVGGHARSHLAALRELQAQGLVELLGVCEAAPQRWADVLDDLRKGGVAVEPDLESLLVNLRGRAALIGVPVGIPWHRPVTEAALEAGYHVVLEKPPAGCIDDLDAMLEAARRADRACAVHFQGIFSKTTQQIKAAILAGRIGRLREIRCKGRWLRTDAYYGRNQWAGTLRLGETWVLDGTINNPFAHQINAGLFLAGAEQHTWASPTAVRAELYHARPTIRGDDTTCLAIQTNTGVDLRFWFTLCSGQPERGPVVRVIGESGRIDWPTRNGAQIRTADGRIEPIPADSAVPSQAVYGNVCDYLLGRSERILCRLADTRPFMVAVSAAYEAAGPPRAIDREFVESRRDEEGYAYYILQGIDDAIEACFETGRMFSEAGAPWASQAAEMSIPEDYRHFRPASADQVPKGY